MAAIKTLVTGPEKAKVADSDAERFVSPYLKDQMSGLATKQGKLSKSYLDTKPQDEFRSDQKDLAAMLQARAAGTAGPSIAEQQLQAGREENLKAALAQQASMRGGYNPLAQRQALNQAAMGGQQVNQQAALLRSQEQQQAENSLAGLLQAGRQQDIGLQQVSVQEKQARDQLVQQYVSMGLSLQQAQFQAQQELAKLKANMAAGNAAAANQAAGGLLSGIAGTAAALATGGASTAAKTATTGTPTV